MRYFFWTIIFLTGIWAPALAQGASADDLTPQELAVIQSIKAQNRPEDANTGRTTPNEPMQAPPPAAEKAAQSGDIKLSEQAKEQAWTEQKETEDQMTMSASPAQPAGQKDGQTEPALQKGQDTQTAEEDDMRSDEQPSEMTTALNEKDLKKCITVAFIDIDVAFNEHPRTQAVKKQIDVRIKAKEREVENAKDIIAALEEENKLISRQLAELKPFYERIATDQELLPRVPQSADALELDNTLNRLIFSGCEVITTSPLNSPARLDDVTERIGANKRIIAERNFFIDHYKYQTREEILNLEKEEVKNILQDIYNQIKSFAKKRNIGAVVRKDEILYGQQPVNVTNDFVSTLKKSSKYRKKK